MKNEQGAKSVASGSELWLIAQLLRYSLLPDAECKIRSVVRFAPDLLEKYG
jgi:hypothetical protein